MHPRHTIESLAPSPLFEHAVMARLQLLEDQGIPYGIYGGGHVAHLLDGRRIAGDADVMIRQADWPAVRDLFSSQAGQGVAPAYHGNTYQVLPLIWPKDCPKELVSFLTIGNLEIKAGSDGLPGYFTFTELVNNHCTAEECGGYTLRFVAPTETLLFKIAHWRDKDQADIDLLIQTGIKIDRAYLEQRLPEIRIADRLQPRLNNLLRSFPPK